MPLQRADRLRSLRNADWRTEASHDTAARHVTVFRGGRWLARAKCRQVVLVVRVLRGGEREASLEHEVEPAAQRIAGGAQVGG